MNQREPKMKKNVWTARGRRGPGGVAIARFSQARLEAHHAHVAAQARLLEHDPEVGPQDVTSVVVDVGHDAPSVDLHHAPVVAPRIRRRPERHPARLHGYSTGWQRRALEHYAGMGTGGTGH